MFYIQEYYQSNSEEYTQDTQDQRSSSLTKTETDLLEEGKFLSIGVCPYIPFLFPGV